MADAIKAKIEGLKQEINKVGAKYCYLYYEGI